MAGTEWKVDKHLNTMTITFSNSPRVVIRWTADQVDDHRSHEELQRFPSEG